MDEESHISEPLPARGRRDHESPPVRPRWVKGFGILAAVLVLLFLVLLLTGNDHGPGRHLGGGNERPPGLEHSGPHP